MWLERLTIQGFRSFAHPPQTIDLSRTINIVYADNSQGKTSLAEALEFLLTGTISRRTFTGSTTREFAECLKNAHLAPGHATFVEGVFVGADGGRRVLRRELHSDFTASRECVTTLTIDGVSTNDLAGIITLSEPPLQTPILLQHSLRYVLSARPQDRATYFKAILDVTSLDRVHDAMKAVADAHEVQPTILEQRVLALLPAASLKDTTGTVTGPSVAAAIREALRSSLHLSPTLEDSALEAEAHSRLSQRAEASFPFSQVEITPPPPPPIPQQEMDRIRAAARTIASAATADAALLKLYEAALPLLPPIQSQPLDCPLCQQPGSLSTTRVDAIRTALDESLELRTATSVLASERQNLLRWLQGARSYLANTTPAILTATAGQRADIYQAALALLFAGEAVSQLETWLGSIDALAHSTAELGSSLEMAQAAFHVSDPAQLAAPTGLDSIVVVQSKLDNVAAAVDAYRTAFAPIRGHINSRIASMEALAKPRELLALLPSVDDIATDIAVRTIRSAAVAALRAAADEVREASKRVLDTKFDALSDEITTWWNLLRPDELSNFSGVQRAGTGRRYLDVKAGLQPAAGATTAVERDAVAVFSDSQLNCLGLSSFLARVSREDTSFVVLDDPIQASDEEHRYTFIRSVPAALLSAGRQVIILSHDQLLAKDLQDLYAHAAPTRIQIVLNTPQAGSTLIVLRDSIEIQLTRAHNLTQDAGVDSRRRASQLVRTEAERFCKRVMVMARRSAGGATALLSDYDGQTLDALVSAAAPALSRDPADSGKLRVMARTLNPGSHDDGAPTVPGLRACIGDLRRLVQDYL